MGTVWFLTLIVWWPNDPNPDLYFVDESFPSEHQCMQAIMNWKNDFTKFLNEDPAVKADNQTEWEGTPLTIEDIDGIAGGFCTSAEMQKTAKKNREWQS